MPTPKELREMGDRAGEEATILELQASVLRHQQQDLYRLADAREGLTIGPKSDTTDTMDASPTLHPEARRSQGHMTKKHRQHPFVQALAREGLTVERFAASIGYKRTTVQSWYRVGEGARTIPRPIAEAIKARLGVPLSAWTRLEK